MRRTLATAALTLALATLLTAGTASADIFEVVSGADHATLTSSRSSRLRPDAGHLRGRLSGAHDPAERRRPEPAGLDADAEQRVRGTVRGAAGALERGAAGALAPRRRRLRDSVAGARLDQQDRVQLRPQHGPELGRCGRLDAVHAGHLAALGHRRRRRRPRRPLGSRGRASTRPRAISPPQAGPHDISRAIFAYNHAQWYVDEVLALAVGLRR